MLNLDLTKRSSKIFRNLRDGAEAIPKRIYYPTAGLLAFAVIFSRRPNVLLLPQFWAEDGRNWFADAYNHGGVYSLLLPEAGYLQTFSRIIAQLSQLFAMEYGPLFFAVAAILVQIVVVLFIVSPRLSNLLENRLMRLAFAAFYLMMPHSWETFANVTNSQWHLGLLSFLILIALPPEKRAWNLFDIAVVVVSILSGPLGLFLVPVAAAIYWKRREKRTLLGILVAGGVVQLFFLVTSIRPIQTELGMGTITLAEIFARHVFISPIIGSRGFRAVSYIGLWNVFSAAAIAAAGIFFVVRAFIKANLELRLFIYFSAAIIAGSLYTPAVSSEPGQWKFLAQYDTGLRYWFIPSLCLFVILIRTAVADPSSIFRSLSAGVVFLSVFGILADWKHPNLKDLNYKYHTERFNQTEAGTTVSIPINPNWEMKLTKK